MASPITTTAANLAGQLFEVAHTIQTLQESTETNPEGKRYVRDMNVDVKLNSITFRVTLAADETFSSGGLQVTPKDELIDAVVQTASAVA